MRKIRFRAWNAKHSLMVEVGLIDFIEEKVQLGSFEYPLDKFPIMQYTGLKDNTEAEVYEGDIVMNLLNGDQWEVAWDETGAGFIFGNITTRSGLVDLYEFEDECGSLGFRIIGNIHQNPELITN